MLRVLVWLMAVLQIALAQAPSDPTFDVASVKLTGGQAVFGNSTRDLATGRFRNGQVTLHDLLMEAYNFRADYQMSGPSWLFVPWLSATKLEVAATFPPGTSEEQFRRMLQSLLVERFHLSAHQEMKDRPVYELVVASGGIRMKESQIPTLNGRLQSVLGRGPGPGGRTRLTGRAIPISLLIVGLENELTTLVIDKTGLTGAYDFEVDYESSVPNTGPLSSLDLSSALQDLGLKIEKKKGSVEVLVIDRLDRQPTEN